MSVTWFYHENNLETKINKNYGGRKEDFVNFKRDFYDRYKAEQLAITGIDEAAISRKVELLSNYYQRVNALNTGGWIKPTSKFRPSILEEFCGYLLKDLPKVTELGLGFYNKKIFAGLSINNSGKVVIKTKDVDFCIAKEFTVKFGEKTDNIIIPIIAIECKTYTDKTMLNEAQFTAQKMKQGSPKARVYILSEGNQVDLKEIPLKGQTPLDQMFVLRRLLPPAERRNRKKKEYSELNGPSVCEFVEHINSDLNSVLEDKVIPPVGKFLLE